jgi:hypothetical protein
MVVMVGVWGVVEGKIKVLAIDRGDKGDIGGDDDDVVVVVVVVVDVIVMEFGSMLKVSDGLRECMGVDIGVGVGVNDVGVDVGVVAINVSTRLGVGVDVGISGRALRIREP